MIFTAITGSIGCGKTTISDILRRFGYLVYDADICVNHLYNSKDFLKIIRSEFPQVFDGEFFNKRKLRTFVFDNPERLKKLEMLIHPFLAKKLRKIIRENNNVGIVFFDVALLYELGWDKFFDYVVLADVDYETQRLRVMARDKISAEDFDKINKLQMSRDEKILRSDFIIDTGVDINKLRKSVVNLLGELK